MNIFILKGHLIPLKSLAQAKEILEESVKQNHTISFKTDDGKIYFEPSQEFQGMITVFNPDENSSVPVEFQFSLEMSIDEAKKELYKYRKFFNERNA